MPWLELDAATLGWMLGLGLAVLVGSAVAVIVLLVRIPADYFVHPRETWRAQSWPRLAWLLVKNVFGGVLVIAGVLMLVLPGQGILTILIGLMLLDFPGRRKLEIKLLRRPGVLATINRLRARFGKPPLVFEQAGAQGHPRQ